MGISGNFVQEKVIKLTWNKITSNSMKDINKIWSLQNNKMNKTSTQKVDNVEIHELFWILDSVWVCFNVLKSLLTPPSFFRKLEKLDVFNAGKPILFPKVPQLPYQLTWDGFADKAEPLIAPWQVPHTVTHAGGHTGICSQQLGVWGFIRPVGVIHRWSIHPGHRIS